MRLERMDHVVQQEGVAQLGIVDMAQLDASCTEDLHQTIEFGEIRRDPLDRGEPLLVGGMSAKGVHPDLMAMEDGGRLSDDLRYP